jgi:hypothetical protein
LKSQIIAETGKDDLESALAVNGTALCFNTRCTSEFLLRAIRWYPSVNAALLSTLKYPYALPFQFAFLVFPLILLCGTAHYFLHDLSGLPSGFALLGAIALMANANFLNVLHEGQYAQVFASPFLFLLFGQFFFFRKHLVQCDAARSVGDWSEYLFSACLATVILCAYPDAVLLTGILPILTGCLDIAAFQMQRLRALVRFLFCVGLGLILAGPYAARWPVFIYRHLSSLNAGVPIGYWQPQWALPADILGFFNIYDPARPEYIGRGAWSTIAVTAASLLCLAVVGLRLSFDRKRERSCWLAAMVFVAVVFVKSYYQADSLNYQYMKAYTLVLLLLFTLFAESLYRLCRNGRWARLIPIGACLWIIGQGTSYVCHYAQEATYLRCASARPDNLRAAVDWGQYAWVVKGDAVETMGYASLVTSVNWIAQGETPHNLAVHEGNRIGIWEMKSGLNAPTLAGASKRLMVLYEDDEVILLDSGLRLGDKPLSAPAMRGEPALVAAILSECALP